MRKLGLLIAPLLFIASAALGQIVPPPPVYNAPGGAPQIANNGTILPYADAHLVPVCSTDWNTEGGLNSSAPLQFNSGVLYKCPRGVKALAVLLSGFYMNPTETDLTAPLPINIGVWANAPAPYKVGVTYSSGDLVSINSDPANGVAFWQAASTTSTAPTATNAAWVAYTPAASLYTPMTCTGDRACTIVTKVNPAGATVAQSITSTNLVQASVPLLGYVYVKIYGVQFGTQKWAASSPIQPYMGGYAQQFATQTDRSITNAAASNYKGWSFGYKAMGIIGIPQQVGPTVCALSHSIGSGAGGTGVSISSGAPTAGGTGYTSADVGVPFVIPNTGAGANAVSRTAQGIIVSQSAGVVTSVNPWYGGQYNNVSTNPGSGSPPSGAQTIVDPVLHGTGMIVTLGTSAGGFDYGDADGYQGHLMRAANINNLPIAAITESSRSTADLVTRSYSTLAAVTALGCSTVIADFMVNDIGSGISTAEANITFMAAQISKLPNVKALGWLYSGPLATSNDGFQANQTGTLTSTLIALNTWLATQANSASGPINCVYDPYTAVSSSPNSGLWLLGGSGNILTNTTEGVHPSTLGNSLIAAVEAPLMLACVK